mgnify:CR=1 FL=1
MVKTPRKPVVSEATKTEAMKLAKANQKPGQTKDQTKLIAQGIQKGIDQYKKQQKAKARELDKQRKKKQSQAVHADTETEMLDQENGASKLPWMLLLLSWGGFAAYLLIV